MKNRWHIIYCDEQTEPCPVTEFVDRLAPKHQVKIIRFLSLLEEMGPTLPRPYADLLRDGIHELRIKLSGDQVRMLYFFCFKKFIVFYLGFIKTRRRVPEKLIDRAKHYRRALLHRTTSDEFEEMIDATV